MKEDFAAILGKIKIYQTKKMAVTATQRNELLRALHLLDIFIFRNLPEFFVFLDKMGSDKWDQKCKFSSLLQYKGFCLEVSTFQPWQLCLVKIVNISTCI